MSWNVLEILWMFQKICYLQACPSEFQSSLTSDPVWVTSNLTTEARPRKLEFRSQVKNPSLGNWKRLQKSELWKLEATSKIRALETGSNFKNPSNICGIYWKSRASKWFESKEEAKLLSNVPGSQVYIMMFQAKPFQSIFIRAASSSLST